MAEKSNGAAQPQAKPEQEGSAQQFSVQKLYVKDVSFETPNSPAVFREKWSPETNVELNVRHDDLGDGLYEVVVIVTVTARQGEKVAYLCEVQQAGVFAVAGFERKTLQGLLASYCPSMLFPYAREAVSTLTGRGGFARMTLARVNFDALYAKERARREERQQGADAP